MAGRPVLSQAGRRALHYGHADHQPNDYTSVYVSKLTVQELLTLAAMCQQDESKATQTYGALGTYGFFVKIEKWGAVYAYLNLIGIIVEFFPPIALTDPGKMEEWLKHYPNMLTETAIKENANGTNKSRNDFKAYKDR